MRKLDLTPDGRVAIWQSIYPIHGSLYLVVGLGATAEVGDLTTFTKIERLDDIEHLRDCGRRARAKLVAEMRRVATDIESREASLDAMIRDNPPTV